MYAYPQKSFLFFWLHKLTILHSIRNHMFFRVLFKLIATMYICEFPKLLHD